MITCRTLEKSPVKSNSSNLADIKEEKEIEVVEEKTVTTTDVTPEADGQISRNNSDTPIVEEPNSIERTNSGPPEDSTSGPPEGSTSGPPEDSTGDPSVPEGDTITSYSSEKHLLS